MAQLGRDADARTELETAVSIPPDDPETRLSLAQVYTRLGEKAKAQELLKGLTGSVAGDSGEDIFAAAFSANMDPVQTENEARQVLYDIGEQFDSGEYDRLGPSAFSSMRLVALSWSRIGRRPTMKSPASPVRRRRAGQRCYLWARTIRTI